MKKTIMILISIVLIITTATGCFKKSMPFNGEISFHDISLTIPDDYIRDSTQSSDDFWVFEKGYYKKYILISRIPNEGVGEKALDYYVNSMSQVGAEVSSGTLNNVNCAFSEYTKDNTYCQEIYFVYKENDYAIALRGGDKNDFEKLTKTINLN